VAIPIRGAELPFTLENGVIVFPAKIGDVAVEAALATGSAETYMNRKVVERHHTYCDDPTGNSIAVLALTGTYPTSSPAFSTARVNGFKALDISPPVSIMACANFAKVNGLVGREISVVVGAGFFRGKILQIDFEKRVLRILDPEGQDHLQSDPLNTQAEQKITLKMKLKKLPVVDGISFNGKEVRALIDTGQDVGIQISPSATSKHKLGNVGKNGSISPGKIASVSLSNFVLTDQDANFVGKEAGFDQGTYGAILGMPVLRVFKTITFDWKKNVVELTR
jgi:hypothetical protein